ncbi:MAG: cytochrome C oxidase subunit IV family protein [Negativicutes bacterium]
MKTQSGKKIISKETALWALLIVATILSFTIVESIDLARIAATVAIIIAALKARLIFVYFMELRWESQPFRLICEIWVAVATIIILGGYWHTALME